MSSKRSRWPVERTSTVVDPITQQAIKAELSKEEKLMELSSGDRSRSRSVEQLPLPPGFRFSPTDEELVLYYLKNQAESKEFEIPVIACVDLYKFDPWKLPDEALFGEKEWYFFSPRDRKYPKGDRPNRAAASGYWKATGTDKPIAIGKNNTKVGVKKSLVFYEGKAPNGFKSNWIMHEYRLDESLAPSATPHPRDQQRLDDWVLCRIYKKNSNHAQLQENDMVVNLSEFDDQLRSDSATQEEAVGDSVQLTDTSTLMETMIPFSTSINLMNDLPMSNYGWNNNNHYLHEAMASTSHMHHQMQGLHTMCSLPLMQFHPQCQCPSSFNIAPASSFINPHEFCLGGNADGTQFPAFDLDRLSDHDFIYNGPAHSFSRCDTPLL